MNRELILPYEGKLVSLVLEGKTPFVLTGHVDKVHDDCITFSTKQKTSLIHFSRIMELTPKESEY